MKVYSHWELKEATVLAIWFVNAGLGEVDCTC